MSLIKKSFILGEANFDCWIYIISNSSGNDEFWFKGRDIANYLEYKNPNDALIKSVLPIWRKNWTALKSIVFSDTPTNTTQSHSEDVHTSTSDNADVVGVEALEDETSVATSEIIGNDVPANWHPHTIL